MDSAFLIMKRDISPRYLSQLASYGVVSTIHQSLPPPPRRRTGAVPSRIRFCVMRRFSNQVLICFHATGCASPSPSSWVIESKHSTDIRFSIIYTQADMRRRRKRVHVGRVLVPNKPPREGGGDAKSVEYLILTTPLPSSSTAEATIAAFAAEYSS